MRSMLVAPKSTGTLSQYEASRDGEQSAQLSTVNGVEIHVSAFLSLNLPRVIVWMTKPGCCARKQLQDSGQTRARWPNQDASLLRSPTTGRDIDHVMLLFFPREEWTATVVDEQSLLSLWKEQYLAKAQHLSSD